MVKPLDDPAITTAAGSIRLTGDQVRAVTFRKPPFLHRGFDEEQVDIFLDWIAETLDHGDPIPVDKLDQASFSKPGLNKRGYHEDDVNAFLRIVRRTVTG